MGQTTRRAFLKRFSGAAGLAAVLCRGAAGAPGTEGGKTTKPPFRVLYNNDATNTADCVSPWHKKGEPFREELLVASIDEVAGKGVDAYLLSPGLGWIPWWQSKVVPDHYAWWTKKTGLEPESYGKYMLAGGDMVRVLVERCRAKGMEPFVSLRLNDTHHQENYGEKNANSIWVSRFYEEHPEYMLDPGHKKVQGYSGSRGQNWMIPEVRAYKLALLEELAANYDLAGIELDFLRDHHLFRQNETTAKQRQEAITGFVRAVRAALDRKGGRRYLCVRIPLQASAHGAIGLHVPDLVAAGVDMFNLSGWYHTTQRNDIAHVRRMAPDAALYLEMTHVCGSLHLFVREQGYTTAGFPRTSDPQFYTTAHLAYARGADGLSLFNFVYYREHGGVRAPVVCEPPFHVLARLADRAWLARQPQYYWLASSVFHSQLPRQLRQGKPERVQFDLALPKAPEQPNARLRIHTQTPLGEAEVSVKMNGTRLERTDDASAFYGNPFDGMMSDPPRRRAWSCPVSLLRDGLNDVEVALASKGPLQLNIIDLAVR